MNDAPRPLPADPLSSLRTKARAAAQSTHAPFSGDRAAAVLLLADGTWVPGVRVESASFSLTIPPALNAFTTAVAAGRRDVVATAFSRPMRPVERAFLNDVMPERFDVRAEDGGVLRDASLPPLAEMLTPFLEAALPASPEEGVVLARSVAGRASVPASHFPVGCVLNVGPTLVPGVNVEPLAETTLTDWTHVLCAERNALGTACSYGLLGDAASRARPTGVNNAPVPDAPVPGDRRAARPAHAAPRLYLSCPQDAEGSPCGACRQLLVELIPDGVLWMDRASDAPERTALPDLLPGSFRGTTLPRSAPSA